MFAINFTKFVRDLLNPSISSNKVGHLNNMLGVGSSLLAVAGCFLGIFYFPKENRPANIAMPKVFGAEEEGLTQGTVPIEILADGRIQFNFKSGSIEIQDSKGRWNLLAETPTTIQLEGDKNYLLNLPKNSSERTLIAVAEALRELSGFVAVDIKPGSRGVTDAVIRQFSKVNQLMDFRVTSAPLITSEGIASLRDLKDLHQLSIHNDVNITDEGIGKLVHESPSLETLGMSGTTKVTKDYINKLHDEYHNKIHKVHIIDDRIKCECQPKD